MIRSILFFSSVFFVSIGALSAAIVGHTFTGKTYHYEAAGFEDEFPLGSEWEVRVEWDDTATATFTNESQASYPLTKFTLTLKGRNGDWTTSSLPGNPTLILNKFGLSHFITFHSGRGPENHTNGMILDVPIYLINLVIADPTGNALPSLNPIPSSIDMALWSPDRENSYLKFHVTELAQPLSGEVDGLGENSEPRAPDIAVKELKGKELSSGKSRIRYKPVKKGKTGKAKKFVISNEGTARLKGIKLTVGGKHKKDFRVGRFSKKSLAPGEKATFKVTFKPTAKGKRKAVVKVASNDEDEKSFDIILTGSGK